jgi:REP element-mobilizing transposase RayT
LPLNEDNVEGKYERFFVVLLPTKQQQALFTTIDGNFRIIMKVLCSMFRIGLVDCIVTSTHLTLALDIPEGYAANEFVGQLKKASTLIIEKKYGPGLTATKTEAFTFWRDELLVTTPELVDTEIKVFIHSIL